MNIIPLLIVVYFVIGYIIGFIAVVTGQKYVSDQQIYLIKVFFKWLFGWPYWTWKVFVS